MALKGFFTQSPVAPKAQPVLGDRRLVCLTGGQAKPGLMDEQALA